MPRFVIRDNHSRARLAVIGLGCTALLEITTVVYSRYIHLHVGDPQLADFDTFEQGVDMAVLAVMLFTVVTFIRWLRRAYENAAAAGMPLGLSLGWAIGGWFVPLWNLFVPYQIVRDTYAYALPQRGSGLVSFWWATYLASRMIDTISSSMLESARTEDSLRFALELGMGGSVVSILAAGAAIAIVRRTTKGQTVFHADIADVFGAAPTRR